MNAWGEGVALTSLSDLAEQRRDDEVALGYVDQAIEPLRDACRLRPGFRSFPVALGEALVRRGFLTGALGEPERGVPDLREGIALLEEVAELYPAAHYERETLMVCRARLAQALTDLDGHGDEVRRLTRMNVREAEELLATAPDRPGRRYTLAMHRHNYAQLVGQLDASWSEVLALEKSVRAAADELLAEQPGLYEYRLLVDRSSYGIARAACEVEELYAARARIEEYAELDRVDARSTYLIAELWARWWYAVERSSVEPAERRRPPGRSRGPAARVARARRVRRLRQGCPGARRRALRSVPRPARVPARLRCDDRALVSCPRSSCTERTPLDPQGCVAPPSFTYE